MNDDPTLSRKRSRHDANITDSDTNKEQNFLSPHTLRLLKLVEEGTTEHARLAAHQLSEITAGSSPLVLWDVLGRLQGYLTSPHWMTRHNASVAMEGVAQRLPLADQQNFLHQSASTYRDQDSYQTSWLTLQDLADNLTIVLNNGRTLFSKAETDYDQLEEDELENLDSTHHLKDGNDFVEQRIQLQRQILARRLGLSNILSRVSGNQMETVFSSDDFQPFSSDPPTKIRMRSNHGTTNDCTVKSIRSLLVSEIQQQQQQQQQRANQDSASTGQSHRMISHHNAQRLLATELVFRMFDASWHVRHGSLMGLLALLRAWNVHGTSYLGIWPQDILARCLCVLALDRFADYSETSTSSGSGGIVAPVREMAGQVIAVLYQSAPESLQRQALELLVIFSTVQQPDTKTEDWEIRHAALLALVYISALQVNHSVKTENSLTFTDWSCRSFQTILEVATTSLSDNNEDVQGKAAQLLIPLLSDKTRFMQSKRFQLYPRIVNHLWKALTTMNLISSSVKDLVGLLSTLISTDLTAFLHETDPKPSHQDPCTFLLSKLKILTTCPYISVKTSVISLIGVASQGVVYFLHSEASNTLRYQSRFEIADSFLEIVKMLYRLYFQRGSLLEDAAAQDSHAFIEACNTTWLSVTRASKTILKGFEQKRVDLEHSMLLHYLDLRPLDCAMHMDIATMAESSFGSRLALRITVADAIAGFLGEPEDCHRQSSSRYVVELCIRVCLESPMVRQCEGACILLSRLCHHNANLSFAVILEKCKGGLITIIEERPRCVAVDKSHLQDSARSKVQVLQHSFECGMKILLDSQGNVDAGVRTITTLWKEVIGKPHVDSTSGPISHDTMRLSVAAAGALVSRGLDHLPIKLTPIVRSLMTSIQNELDDDCRDLACRHMVSLLEILSGVLPNERREALCRTRSKILENLCRLITSNLKPGASNASITVSLLVAATDHPLPTFEAIWESLSVLAGTQVSPDRVMGSLLVLDAVCSDIGKNKDASELVISSFLPVMVSRHCFSSDPTIVSGTRSCVECMVAIGQVSALPVVLPPMALLCKNEADVVRERACDLLSVVISGPAMPLCPYVRSLLPLAMQLMTDSSSSTCCKAASRIFSKLVQLAPLVEESAEMRLIQDGWSDNADKVMDHLIRGKALPPCEIHPTVLDALSTAGVSLRHYQLEGIAWLRFLQSVRLNGALTDSMGLGKTLQALVGVALAHTDTHPMVVSKSIVICPSSVLGHWMKEVKTFFPSNHIFQPFCLQGQKGKKEIPEECNLIITSYAVLRSDIDRLSRLKWCYCVLDEGHLMKNPKTATAKAARKLRARYKLILTGTPVQNKVHEVWATFDFLMPNFLGSSVDFSKEFAGPIVKGQAQGASATDIAVGMERLKLLHQQVLPFILRREKEQVLQELPPKIITTIPCEMTSRQLQLYDEFCSSNKGQNSLRAFDQAIQQPSTERALPTLGSDVLKALLYLRLLCTHPALVNSKGFAEGGFCNLDCSGKLLALKELLRASGMPCQDLSAADNDTSLMYVNAEDSDYMQKNDFESVIDPGADDDALPSYSSDRPTVGCKFLIFTQFTFSLDVVEEFLQRYFPGTLYLRLDGKVPIEMRSEIVDSFNSQEKIQILLLTTRIGGLGLNLTGADTVVFLEHDWNPHADLQAMDRAHRIGQKKTVHVYKLVTSNSIEEKIMQLQESKLAMSNAIVNTENSTLYSMGTDQLLDIFRFRSDKSDPNNKHSENTLDILVERYEDEYSSLALSDFIASLSN